MNERVKELRKALGLSGEKFGETLGVSRFAISQIETGRNNLTEQAILAICYLYNVSEDWLRTGNGNMFNETDDSFLAKLKREYNLTDCQTNLVKTYLELTDAEKSAIDKLITSTRQNPDDKEI